MKLIKNFLSKIPAFKRWQRARLRQVMRGYRALKKSGCLDAVDTLKGELTIRQLGLQVDGFSPAILGSAIESAELVLRQYLLLRIGGVNLNCALLVAVANPGAGVVFPMPKQWRNLVAEHGFKVSRWRSSVLWQLYVFALLAYGVLRIAKVMLDGIWSFKDAHLPKEGYAYFADLVPGNLPQQRAGASSHDIVSWYLQWPGRDQNVKAIRHSVSGASCIAKDGIPIRFQDGPLPSLAGLVTVARYFG